MRGKMCSFPHTLDQDQTAHACLDGPCIAVASTDSADPTGARSEWESSLQTNWPSRRRRKPTIRRGPQLANVAVPDNEIRVAKCECV